MKYPSRQILLLSSVCTSTARVLFRLQLLKFPIVINPFCVSWSSSCPIAIEKKVVAIKTQKIPNTRVELLWCLFEICGSPRLFIFFVGEKNSIVRLWGYR
ncbi:hypothetical protein LY78DRAFT_654044 [Colletotrichum sublineola]|nr:hypothetical protein LY78DRAFT_654044 [Colletotrichum sublineola]